MVLWFKCQLGTGWGLILVFSQVFCVTADKLLWLSSNEACMHMRLDWIDTSHVKVGTTDPILILLSVKYGVATLSSCTLQVCLVYDCLGLRPLFPGHAHVMNFKMVQRYLSQAPVPEAAELLQLSSPAGLEGYQNTSNVDVGKHAC